MCEKVTTRFKLLTPSTEGSRAEAVETSLDAQSQNALQLHGSRRRACKLIDYQLVSQCDSRWDGRSKRLKRRCSSIVGKTNGITAERIVLNMWVVSSSPLTHISDTITCASRHLGAESRPLRSSVPWRGRGATAFTLKSSVEVFSSPLLKPHTETLFFFWRSFSLTPRRIS